MRDIFETKLPSLKGEQDASELQGSQKSPTQAVTSIVIPEQLRTKVDQRVVDTRKLFNELVHELP